MVALLNFKFLGARLAVGVAHAQSVDGRFGWSFETRVAHRRYVAALWCRFPLVFQIVDFLVEESQFLAADAVKILKLLVVGHCCAQLHYLASGVVHVYSADIEFVLENPCVKRCVPGVAGIADCNFVAALRAVFLNRLLVGSFGFQFYVESRCALVVFIPIESQIGAVGHGCSQRSRSVEAARVGVVDEYRVVGNAVGAVFCGVDTVCVG